MGFFSLLGKGGGMFASNDDQSIKNKDVLFKDFDATGYKLKNLDVEGTPEESKDPTPAPSWLSREKVQK